KIERAASDSRFPSFQQGFNMRWAAPNLDAVYLCFSAEGTAAALDDALASYGDGIQIKGGGHCYEDFVYNPDTRAVLDVGPMDGVGVDETRGFYLDAGGTNWSAFETLFRRYGKVLPAGSCYSVGLGGHICGGGYGFLSRLHGLTVDWLTGVDIVVRDDPGAPARLVHVGRDSVGDEADLYWAQLGGGGGNFGVITRYYFARLPDAPSRAVIATLAFDWQTLTVDKLSALLAAYAEISARNDNRELFGAFKLMHRSAGEIQLVLQVAADDLDAAHRAEHETFADLRRALAEVHPHRRVRFPITGHPGWSTVPAHACPPVHAYTFYEAVQTLNGSGPNQRGKYKSAYMRKPFPDDQVAALFEHLQLVPPGLDAQDMQQSLVQVDTYGGAINDIASTATAVPQRSSILKLQYQTYWQDRSHDAAHLEWIRSLYSAVYARTAGVPDPTLDPTDNVDGCYFNYPDVDLGRGADRDRALHLYFLDNFRRGERNLVAVKRRWNPSDLFCSGQSIPVD
ncbi:MAG: FAD-binding protein, partial [Acidobacteriota bacterium]